jgi:hypothetical protein
MLAPLTLDWPRLFRWQTGKDVFAEADFRRLEISGSIFHPAVDPWLRMPAPARSPGWRAGSGSRQAASWVGLRSPRSRLRRQGTLGIIVGFQNSSHFRSARRGTFYRYGQRISAHLQHAKCPRQRLLRSPGSRLGLRRAWSRRWTESAWRSTFDRGERTADAVEASRRRCSSPTATARP